MAHTNVREGFVTIERTTDPKRVHFIGLPVLGYTRRGQLCNRQIFVSRAAPEWFKQLCLRHAGSSFEIHVRTIALSGGAAAFVVPTAESEAQAMAQWRERQITHGRAPLPDPVQEFEQACKAHEFKAHQAQLVVLTHHNEGAGSYTTAQDSEGVVYKLSGGMIVNKLSERINEGATTWEQEVDRFVRIKPYAPVVRPLS